MITAMERGKEVLEKKGVTVAGYVGNETLFPANSAAP
jgi:hypothetical protein